MAQSIQWPGRFRHICPASLPFKDALLDRCHPELDYDGWVRYSLYTLGLAARSSKPVVQHRQTRWPPGDVVAGGEEKFRCAVSDGPSPQWLGPWLVRRAFGAWQFHAIPSYVAMLSSARVAAGTRPLRTEYSSRKAAAPAGRRKMKQAAILTRRSAQSRLTPGTYCLARQVRRPDSWLDIILVVLVLDGWPRP